MITMIVSASLGLNIPEILGYLLIGCEALIVILTLLSFFISPDSKFGKILKRLLRGLYSAKKYVASYPKQEDESEKEEE